MSKSIFFTEKSQIVPLQPSCWHICSLGPCFETSIDKNIYRYCNDCYELLWHIVWWVFFRELIFNWICSIRYRHSGNLIHGSNKNSKKEDDFIYSIWKTVSNIRVTHFLFYVVDDQEFEKNRECRSFGILLLVKSLQWIKEGMQPTFWIIP